MSFINYSLRCHILQCCIKFLLNISLCCSFCEDWPYQITTECLLLLALDLELFIFLRPFSFDFSVFKDPSSYLTCREVSVLSETLAQVTLRECCWEYPEVTRHLYLSLIRVLNYFRCETLLLLKLPNFKTLFRNDNIKTFYDVHDNDTLTLHFSFPHFYITDQNL